MTMKTLKQHFRDYGYEVNRDDQKGIGNMCLENVLKVIKVWIKESKNKSELIFELENL